MLYRLCVVVALAGGALRSAWEAIMAQDPRLDSLAQYAMTAVSEGPTDENAVLRQRVETLERLVSVLLRTPNVQEIAGTPTQAARNGTLAVDTSALKLWVRRNGAWVSATLA